MSARPRITHTFKCWPEFFEPTLLGIKQFELRRDDRPEGFQVGDELLLKEYNPTVADAHFSHTSDAEAGEKMGYTGRECLVRVGYVMPAEQLNALVGGLLEGYVLMSVRLV